MKSRQEKQTAVLRGVVVSPGIAIGKAFHFDRLESQVAFYKLRDKSHVSHEIKRFRDAVAASLRQLREIRRKLGRVEGVDPLYILDVHIMLLKDRSFLTQVTSFIRTMEVNAEWAVRMAIDKYREIFDKVEDEYIRGRFSDIQYAGNRILRNLGGHRRETVPDLDEGIIVIATDLSPADTAQMKIDRVQGFAIDMGSKTSHTAIVARSLEIPAVVGLERITRVVKTNDNVIIDGSAGLVIVNPDPEILFRYEGKKRDFDEARLELLADARLPAVTKDGHSVDIGCNIEFMEEIPSAVTHGADGIGLYRTEFLYINRENLPTEEDHLDNYRRVLEERELRWATIRTLDLGGDKFFSDPKLAKEMNPQMGLRAIRLCLREENIFRAQLRAILRAGADERVRILIPMVSGIEEIREAKRILAELKDDLAREGIPAGLDLPVGVMIEVPSAVVIAEELAREADFFSIGTNDLIQYALAIDRINERVSYLYEPLHPAVLRLIRQVVEAGHRAGIPVAMCGEMAGDPLYTLILLGFGLDELSMNPLAIPRVKRIIRASTRKESRRLLKRIFAFSSAAEIRSHVEDYMHSRFPEAFPAAES
ncbi:MAG TPA: phosphoenolpyruvate--protein phosphotransferase [Syntrophales bacterium]|nr:phosphoenolpyruvate--protein phosphotransferase [Syntrophales bacterium]